MRKFNVAWWAYSFPLTFLAMAASAYAQEVKGLAASGLVLILTVLSVFIFICLLFSTALNIEMLFRGSDPILKFESKGKWVHACWYGFNCTWPLIQTKTYSVYCARRAKFGSVRCTQNTSDYMALNVALFVCCSLWCIWRFWIGNLFVSVKFIFM